MGYLMETHDIQCQVITLQHVERFTGNKYICKSLYIIFILWAFFLWCLGIIWLLNIGISEYFRLFKPYLHFWDTFWGSNDTAGTHKQLLLLQVQGKIQFIKAELNKLFLLFFFLWKAKRLRETRQFMMHSGHAHLATTLRSFPRAWLSTRRCPMHWQEHWREQWRRQSADTAIDWKLEFQFQ